MAGAEHLFLRAREMTPPGGCSGRAEQLIPCNKTGDAWASRPGSRVCLRCAQMRHLVSVREPAKEVITIRDTRSLLVPPPVERLVSVLEFLPLACRKKNYNRTFILKTFFF